MIRQHDLATKNGKIGQFDVLAARDNVTLLNDSDAVIEAQLRSEDPSVDNNLKAIKEIYGEEHLNSLSDTELYKLYKLHMLGGAK